ncbi:hypothetical protein L0Y49_04680, partial [bacterium]|nr:hypothetical protein [bacterium]
FMVRGENAARKAKNIVDILSLSEPPFAARNMNSQQPRVFEHALEMNDYFHLRALNPKEAEPLHEKSQHCRIGI